MHVNTQTNKEIFNKLVYNTLSEYGVTDIIFADRVAETIKLYHIDLLKFNKWFIIRKILESCAKEYPRLAGG